MSTEDSTTDPNVTVALARMEAKLDVAIAQHSQRLDEHSRRLSDHDRMLAQHDSRLRGVETAQAADAANAPQRFGWPTVAAAVTAIVVAALTFVDRFAN